MERSPGGVRMFRDSDVEWLRVIGCMKQAGMSIRDIREYIEMALQGDDTIELRLELFRRQRDELQSRMDELCRAMEMVEYKCWYYETAKAAGSMSALKEMKESDIPERFRRIREELRGAARPPEEGQVVPPEVFAYRLSRPGS